MRYRRGLTLLLLFATLGTARGAESTPLPSPSSSPSAAAPAGPPLLLRSPTVSRTQLVFCYAGDLWIADRDGGNARRLTTAVGEETHPSFSPDGTMIAFTGTYDGNQDVFVVPAEGGEPRRLTFHPSAEIVDGWTPDGRKILFHSDAEDYDDELYTVPVTGGFPEKLPLGNGYAASFSPDGTHIAYVPHDAWEHAEKRYRGGQTTPIWLADLGDSSIEKIPRDNSNDSCPMWVGDTVYFLSDRDGPVSMYAYDTKQRTVRPVVQNDGLDLKSASATSDAIVYEQFGSLHLLDLASGQTRLITVHPKGDLAETRSHFVTVDPSAIRNFGLSPTGVRAVFEAWGEILTVPADKGDIRNLTRTPAVAERNPAWSPDGRSIACFSDASGEYSLEIRDQSGLGDPRRIDLGSPPSFFYTPVWSPDAAKIAYSDKRLNLWYVAVAGGKPIKIDTDYYDNASFSPSWSPDSKWIAYVKQLPNRLHAVFLYSLASGSSFRLTDGMSDAAAPYFDPNGKYLYFAASTDVGLTASRIDMSSFSQPVTRSVYVAVLAADQPSPLAPQSDEEKPREGGGSSSRHQGEASAAGSASQPKDKADTAGSAPKPRHGAPAAKAGTEAEDSSNPAAPPPDVHIDPSGISQRILALPIPARNYVAMRAGKTGVLFLAEAPLTTADADEGTPSATLQKFDLATRKTETFVDGVDDFTLSADGAKLLYRKGTTWTVAGTEAAPGGGEPKPGEGPLKLGAMQVYVDPRAMWSQMYHEVWRIERDFFYDPGYHGLDLVKIEEKYRPYLAGIASRNELTYLLSEALGEMSVGHMFVGGGDEPQPKTIKGGLLGADYTIENGRYRIKRIYYGENWNPGLTSPLTQPDVNVKEGDYLLSVNGRDLTGSDNVYQFFENTAGRQVALTVGSDPGGKGGRQVTVVPIDDEHGLRRHAWMERNRERVDSLTAGRVAYVYLPDTGHAGYSNFIRYYFAQVDKQAAIIDERFNEGGKIGDYIIDYLRRPLLARAMTREGADWNSPAAAIYGPKVMIINEMAGSGGDALPWFFRKAGIGPLVGKRTWGGLVGLGSYPTLMDGGTVTAPRFAFYGLEGQWEVENHGIAPDYDVDQDPKLLRLGHDPQLEKAVEVVLDLLAKYPPAPHPRPAYPNYHQSDGLGR